VRCVMLRFACVVVAAQPTIPGLPILPAYYRIDVDTTTGKIIGLA
jgi:hypothetical protein